MHVASRRDGWDDGVFFSTNKFKQVTRRPMLSVQLKVSVLASYFVTNTTFYLRLHTQISLADISMRYM